MQKSKSKGSSKWLVPLLALSAGGAYLVFTWIGGNPVLGAALFAIMFIYAGLLLLGGRVELIRALRGQFDDERYRSFEVQATAFSGLTLIVTLLGGLLYELARGGNGQPYAMLCAVGAVSYLAALIWLRWRS